MPPYLQLFLVYWQYCGNGARILALTNFTATTNNEVDDARATDAEVSGVSQQRRRQQYYEVPLQRYFALGVVLMVALFVGIVAATHLRYARAIMTAADEALKHNSNCGNCANNYDNALLFSPLWSLDVRAHTSSMRLGNSGRVGAESDLTRFRVVSTRPTRN